MLVRLANQDMFAKPERLDAFLGSPCLEVASVKGPPLPPTGSSFLSPFAIFALQGRQDSQSASLSQLPQHQDLSAVTVTSSAAYENLPGKNVISLPSTMLASKEATAGEACTSAASSLMGVVCGRIMDLDVHPDVRFELDWER